MTGASVKPLNECQRCGGDTFGVNPHRCEEEVKCGCVYATSANTESVRKGYEMGGYVKEFCHEHAKPDAVEEVKDANGETPALDAIHALILDKPKEGS